MNKIIYTVVLFLVVSSFQAQNLNYEVIDGDTINLVDEQNLKQGFWKIFGKMKKTPNYEPDQIVEEGSYKSSRKQGLWKKFFASGKIKNEITYVNSRPNGYYKIYFENGQIEEEGSWKSNRNTGSFKRYYENGQVSQEFVFNESGKRDGEQKYFYDNGQVMIIADISQGKEKFVKEFFENGELKAEKVFIDGKLDVENTKVYEAKEPVKDRVEAELEAAPVRVVVIDSTDKDNLSEAFDGNGHKKMYNKNKQLSKVGVFKNYRLMEGEWYKYDDNGILMKIEKFKKGRYIGDAPLPKD